ncbi:serine/threonine protein kinase [Mucilaginibacter mali]|uniref:Serine/threonine protein kinase n=1 Tax=Mucilaginibacter mali TaxID=2740462 RepID=A0A7D4Q885_9SPHI|nr:serine/threonine-protein kinase [Mucilaginibacter mali]QKJ29545.1 serine/threonine protein kinase [Mucilaginibacter mali]
MSKVFTITDGLENMGALRTGGQGSVYKGRRIGPIISAVKILPTPIHTESTDDKNYRNFLNEVEKLKKVNEVPNPNVVKILNSGITESGSFPFIEMEFIEGPDLGELLAEPHDKIFTLKEVVKLADQLSCALAHCHGVGVKHGDIKSNNIKFNVHSGNYVLLDFGLSIMSDEQRRSSMRHAGAIEFMAPEQNEGKMEFQTDVYSYGVILYELITGTVPFPLHDNGETSRNTVMLAHMESPVPDMLKLRKQNMPKDWPQKQRDREMRVPAWLLALVYKCLEKKPENRYANGDELHDAIIENSIADIRWEEPAEVTPTVTEQEAKAVVDAGYVNNEADSNMMQISKPVFWGLMLLLIGFMSFTGYALFKNKSGQTDMVAKLRADSIRVADSLNNENNKALAEQQQKDRRDSAIRASIRADIEKRKKEMGEADTSTVDSLQEQPPQ